MNLELYMFNLNQRQGTSKFALDRSTVVEIFGVGGIALSFPIRKKTLFVPPIQGCSCVA